MADQNHLEKFLEGINAWNECPRFRRFAQDQDFIEELREESIFGRFLYWLWLIVADCGRSFWPLLLWSFIFFFLFGAIYADYSIPSWLSWLPQPFKEFFRGIDPKIEIPRSHSNFTPYYFSVVTFTTLGFGDVKPSNLAGEIFVVIEVLLGYMMLGLLISILANKIARRS